MTAIITNKLNSKERIFITVEYLCILRSRTIRGFRFSEFNYNCQYVETNYFVKARLLSLKGPSSREALFWLIYYVSR